uniref:PANC n=1 Tax=Arundo donax TaxID=35708 RepID=A0A0A8YJL2_ARUDO
MQERRCRYVLSTVIIQDENVLHSFNQVLKNLRQESVSDRHLQSQSRQNLSHLNLRMLSRF